MHVVNRLAGQSQSATRICRPGAIGRLARHGGGGFKKTIFDGQNRNTDTGGRWNIDSNLMWYWNHAYIRSGTCGNCETDPSVDTTASSTDVPLGSTLKWRESCDWDNNPDTKNEWKDSTPTLERSASGGIKVTGLCAGGKPTDYDGDFGDGNHPDGGDYIQNGQFNGKPRYTQYYNGHS